MDVDEVLPALPTGPRGVAGGLLQRLEQEALAEQAALEAAARGEKPASAAASTSNGAADDRPTYVPGQKRSVNPVEATSASTARDPAAGPSTAPESSGSKEHNQNATSNNATSSSTRLPSPSEPPVKKARVQPTIRMQFTFPPYPPGKDPIAKHVPIFNVRDLAESKGLLLPSEDVLMDEGSSSGGSDDEGGDEEGSGNDNEGGETSAPNAKPKEDETDAQRQLREAIEMARRSKKPILTKKRVLDRDEGYDAEDPFVDDSELAINEPKVQARPKVEGYVAIQGEVELYSTSLISNSKNEKKEDGSGKDKQKDKTADGDVDGKGRKGRKAGSVNRPKVPMTMPDGTVKMVSEAVAAREAKKAAKADGRIISGPGAPSSASASPAPTAGIHGSPGKGPSNPDRASESVPPPSHNYSSLNPNGPLMSRDATVYSHLPSSTTFGFPQEVEVKVAAETPPPPSRNGTEQTRPSVPPTSNSAIGSRTSPITLDDEADVDMSFAPSTSGNTPLAHNGPSRSAPLSSSSAQPPRTSANVFAFDPSPNKKDGKRVYDYQPVSATLEHQLDVLRQAVSKESFVPKNKFPTSVKPILMETALTAMRTGEYDDNFFNIMPNIFPYNRFTMHKMIKREVCEIRCAQLEEEIKTHVEELKGELDKVLPEAIKNYDEQIKKWEEDMAAWQREKGTIANENGATNGNGQSGLAADGQQNVRNSLTPVGSDGDLIPPAPQADANANDAGPPKPLPKFRFTQGMRMCLFKIMTLSSEVTERQIEKAAVEDKDPPSAMNATKARYAILVQLWPEGWMTSNQLSRELTQAKKKVASQMNR